MWELIGLLGMLAIEASYVPQIIKLYKTQKAGDVSPLFPGMNLLGRVMAFSYSMHLGQAILGFGFFIGMTLRAVFLVQVLYYQNLSQKLSPNGQRPKRQPRSLKINLPWPRKGWERRAS